MGSFVLLAFYKFCDSQAGLRGSSNNSKLATLSYKKPMAFFLAKE
jgi:hypothetical protein